MKKSPSLIPGAHWRAGIIAFLFAGLFVLTTNAPGHLAHAQFCNPASVSYIVRDEHGRPLTEAALTAVAEQTRWRPERNAKQ